MGLELCWYHFFAISTDLVGLACAHRAHFVLEGVRVENLIFFAVARVASGSKRDEWFVIAIPPGDALHIHKYINIGWELHLRAII